ncbi:phospholipid hydroperoxide glutathione peroxidase GPX4-like [Symsagittifera roscoffensis]|uniref:phospholipid hydroperoxide glutathione peroxidase GPX4-like n=1 Tax=Symsagittifera roscoffensis TaxID=84072 RepID=UPI00307C2138
MVKDIGPIANPNEYETIHQFRAIDIDGNEVSLKEYSGYVCVVLNTASNNQQIKDYIKSFNVTYDIFAKVKVSCCGQHPLFSFLGRHLGNCKWNFTKYLVDKKGVPRMRFGLSNPPVDMVKDIERMMSERE